MLRLPALAAILSALVGIGPGLPISAPGLPISAPGTPSAWNVPPLRFPTAIQLGPRSYNLKLNPRRDYILSCPPGRVQLPWTLSVWGGRNVVLQNCNLRVDRNWVASFKDQSGTLWVRDVHFGGRRLTGGIQLQEPAATVVLRDVLFDTVYGSYHTNHAELIQSWAGPRRLLIDGLTGATTYQGLFLLPNQLDPVAAPRVFDLRHININDSTGAYALWLGDLVAPIDTWHVSDVYVKPNPHRRWRGWWLWPRPHGGRSMWAAVRAGTPPGGNYVGPVTDGATGVDQAISPVAVANET